MAYEEMSSEGQAFIDETLTERETETWNAAWRMQRAGVAQDQLLAEFGGREELERLIGPARLTQLLNQYEDDMGDK